MGKFSSDFTGTMKSTKLLDLGMSCVIQTETREKGQVSQALVHVPVTADIVREAFSC